MFTHAISYQRSCLDENGASWGAETIPPVSTRTASNVPLLSSCGCVIPCTPISSALPLCADCGTAICSDCCGQSFCEVCGDYHVTHECVRRSCPKMKASGIQLFLALHPAEPVKTTE